MIVSALAARPSGPTPALLGAAAVLGAAIWLRQPLSRIPLYIAITVGGIPLAGTTATRA